MVDLKSEAIAIIGFGNQARAQAQNLRDSGYQVIIGLREHSQSRKSALDAGFRVAEIGLAVEESFLVMVLIPDSEIPKVLERVMAEYPEKLFGLSCGAAIAFSKSPLHGRLFLIGPKAAGSVLRQAYCEGRKVPGVVAFSQETSSSDRKLVAEYAQAIGLNPELVHTTFKEEAACDLFGEQAVLCGGLLELIAVSYDVLVRQGTNPQMAFLEVCYEVRTILDLLLARGPKGMADSISPAALYGGLSRAKRVIPEETVQRLQSVLDDIESGRFLEEANDLESARDSWKHRFSRLDEGFQSVKGLLH